MFDSKSVWEFPYDFPGVFRLICSGVCVDCILVSTYIFMASDDVQKIGEQCQRDRERCEPEFKNLSLTRQTGF